MFRSSHNSEITYIFTWGKPVRIEGTGELCREDANIGKDGWPGEYSALHICGGITAIKSGYLEQFRMLKILVLDSSVERIEMTDELGEMLKEKEVIIRGMYNTFAERFAAENGLAFVHKDIYLGIQHSEEHDESRTVTLHFTQSGDMELLYEDFCVGASAGNTIGGEFTRQMPKDFRKGCTPEEFADMMPSAYSEQIMKNAELKAFLEAYAER